MSLAGRFLAGFFGLAGLPLAGLLVQQGLAAPWVAVVLLVLYEVVILLGAIVASVAQQVVRRRIEQLMDFIDLALGRRVSRYTRYYRRYVLERDRHINARDLAHTPSHIPELDAVYVDVGLAPGSPSGRSGGLLPTSRVEQAQRQSIHAFLDKEEATVCAIIGAPGSGKSTLLRHTARRAASQRKKERRRRIPVMVALRDHAGALTSESSPTLAGLIRAEVGVLDVAEPPGWWEMQLKRGNCLILLDGLDEVARSEDRAALAEWIEKQIAKHPGNDFVITSRPHGYQTAVISQAAVLQMRPFTTEQIRRFIRAWCRAAERLATGTSGPEIDHRAEEEAEDLIGQLASAPALMELAVNPLLLTMMVMVHRERRSLPAGRADLYHQVCDVMLWRRQESKKLEVKPPGPVRQRILATLAYEMMVAETRDFPKGQVLEVFGKALQQIDTDIDAEQLLTAIVESSGLLIEREKDQYSFAHHTIGEYLASTHIRSNNLATRLIETVGDPWWRETTLLYATDADANLIVEACLEQNSGASLSLALECVRSHGQLDRHLRARLTRLLDEAFAIGKNRSRRKLVASALASSHLSRITAAGNGSLVCPHPIPEDLYWLYCEITDTRFREGNSTRRPSPTEPATGVLSGDVESFILWLNDFAVQENAPTYRLPTIAEVRSIMDDERSNIRFDRDKLSIWTAAASDRSVPRPWARDGSDPYAVSLMDMREAVHGDLTASPMVVDLILVGALLDARAVVSAFSDRIKIDRAFDLVPVIECNLNLARRLMSDSGCELQPFNKRYFDAACAFAVELAQTPKRARFSRMHLELANGLEHAISHSSSESLRMEPLPFVGRSHLSANFRNARRESVMGLALSRALSVVEQHCVAKFESPLSQILSKALVASAGFHEGFATSVDPQGLAGTLRSACSAVNLQALRQQRSGLESLTSRLLSEAAPLLSRAKPMTPSNIAEVRVPALMLAAEADQARLSMTGEEFRRLVAGITLLEMRATGQAPLETILLARE